MRRSSMAVFRMAGAAVVAMSFARLARLMKSTSHSAVAEAPDVNRVSELADQLAARILAAIESGELTREEFRNSPEVALILRTATILQDAGVKFPPNMCRLGQKAAEQTQI
jgi:hypothetical protein